jgi:hypothetical protein
VFNTDEMSCVPVPAIPFELLSLTLLANRQTDRPITKNDHGYFIRRRLCSDVQLSSVATAADDKNTESRI